MKTMFLFFIALFMSGCLLSPDKVYVNGADTLTVIKPVIDTITRTDTTPVKYDTIFMSSGSPTIIEQPTNQSATLASPVTFSLQASGTMPLAYSWTENGTVIGINSNTLLLTSVGMVPPFLLTTKDTNAIFQCRVSNIEGSVLSNICTLNITTTPIYKQAPLGWDTLLTGPSSSGQTWIANDNTDLEVMNPINMGFSNLGSYLHIYLSPSLVPFILKIVGATNQACSCDVYIDSTRYLPACICMVSASSVLNELESSSTATVAEGESQVSVLGNKIQWKISYLSSTSITVTDLSGKYFLKPVTFNLRSY